MIKDIGMVVTLAGAVVSGAFYVHDIKRDVAELSVDYRQHVSEQQEVGLMEKKWKIEDRLKKAPDDEDARRDLEIVNRLLEKNQMQRQILKGGKN